MQNTAIRDRKESSRRTGRRVAEESRGSYREAQEIIIVNEESK